MSSSRRGRPRTGRPLWVDARNWLRGYNDGGYRLDPQIVTSHDQVAAEAFAPAAEAVTSTEVAIRGLQGVTLDYARIW